MRAKKGRRIPYERQNFYVFYDEKDNVRYCGTASQLISEGNIRVYLLFIHQYIILNVTKSEQ